MKLIDLTGRVFGNLTVISRDYSDKAIISKQPMWICRCACGNEVSVRGADLRSGNTQSCGCMRAKTIRDNLVKDIAGQQFGRWTVLETIPDYKNHHTYCKCICECGTEKYVYKDLLLNGKSQSCGCLAREKTGERCKKDYVGHTFGELTVVEMLYGYKNHKTYCKCVCTCGNEHIVSMSNLISGHTKSCGCKTKDLTWDGRRRDLVGQTFGDWTVLEMKYSDTSNDQTVCVCRCKCGTIKDVLASNLTSNKTQSCGCNSKSIGERIIEEILKRNNITFLPQYRFDDCKDTYTLPFDFYLPELNTCIEYNGIQHFEPVDYFGGEEALLQVQRHDKMKQEYCYQHCIKFLSLPYTLSTEEIEHKILNI